MDRIMSGTARASAIVVLVVAAAIGAWLSDAGAVTCPDATNKGTLPLGGGFQDLNVTGPCTVAGTTGTDTALYQYGNINIYVSDPANPAASAYLKFADAKIDFWAHSILVENRGQLLAGVNEKGVRLPIGTAGGRLRIYIWGKSTDTPIACKSVWNKSGKTPDDMGPCGIDPTIWKSNAVPASQPTTSALPGGVTDYFYNYNLMPMGTGKDANSFFGSKVIAVSFGGTMKFAGARGASYMIGADTPSNTGTSWVRLTKSLKPQDKEMIVKGLVDWQKFDHIVITSTDYIPGHAEELVVQFASQNVDKTTTIRFTNVEPGVTGVKYFHNGATYNLATKLSPTTVTALGYSTVETRAAVGLLTRSIEILSAGDMMGDMFPLADSTVQPNYFFGAHSLVRQGFAAYQLQGVGFYQMGQGGEIAHYPVHFHMVRQAPNDTYVKDCSVWDSMTRWMTLHATQNVTLQRNVGYKSIGHGYYIEDGAEANNRLFANLGVLARAAVKNRIVSGKSVGLNPRNVPGILVAPNPPGPSVRGNQFPYYSDVDQPSVFWIMNGWNDFEYNMASGAGTCGACYWLVPGQNSGRENTFQFGNGPNDYKAPLPNSAMIWRGYAAMQGSFTGANGPVIPTPMPTMGPPPPVPPSIQALAQQRAGMTPLYKFVGNSCSSAMNSFVTVGGLAACNGVGAATTSPTDIQRMIPIANPAAPPIPPPDPNGIYKDVFYPRVTGLRHPTRCGDNPNPTVVNSLDCSSNKVAVTCSANSFNPPPTKDQSVYNCEATVLDHYTTSFNWAQTNFAAVWLRPFWHLLVNSAITDSQNGGVTFVTGGDYTRSSVIDGSWDVAKKTVFIGHTQTEASSNNMANPFASALGPFNPLTGVECPITDTTLKILPAACIIADEQVDFEVTNFSENQRLFSIYDGPAYQDTDAFVDVEPSVLSGLACSPTPTEACPQATQIYARLGGILKDSKNQCYLPNAAIAWKSPNGFFYPPAFHSVDLSFANTPIRHFVIEPEFVPGSFGTNISKVQKRYCTYPVLTDPTKGLFAGFSDIDRQTVLNDDDGTLTGLKATATPPVKPDQETISVNFDDFFDAPIEAVECGSDVSNPPATFPPGTAKTSPYEHLTTVVYPACARQGGPPAPEIGCGMAPGAPPAGQNPNWGSDCTAGVGPNGCYGVPLLRQDLLSGEAADPNLQSIRMMGANEWQRNALTNNYGTYYIDTASGSAAQTGSPVKNIFEANKTYYVFLVYAKPTTHQTYQMWIGPGLADNWAETNVFMTRVFPATINFQTFDQTPSTNWPSTWTRKYNSTTGILTVTVDMNFTDFTTNFAEAEKDFCLPDSFCILQSNKCVCNPAGRDFKLCQANNICGAWAGKDVDWPGKAVGDPVYGVVNGAYGFGLRFPGKFAADSGDHRPTPACVMMADTGWNIPLVQAKIPGDACFNTPVQFPAGSSPLFCK